jgi:hypothetical protein
MGEKPRAYCCSHACLYKDLISKEGQYKKLLDEYKSLEPTPENKKRINRLQRRMAEIYCVKITSKGARKYNVKFTDIFCPDCGWALFWYHPSSKRERGKRWSL